MKKKTFALISCLMMAEVAMLHAQTFTWIQSTDKQEWR